MSLLPLQGRNGGIKLKNFNQFKQMLLAQLKLTFREKQAWFWGIFFPVILMVIFMVIFSGDSDEDFQSNVVFVDENPTETTKMMYSNLKVIPFFEVKSAQPVTLELAKEKVKNEEVDAAIVLPSSTEESSIKLLVNKENERNVNTQVTAGIIDEYILMSEIMMAGVTPTYELELEAISTGNSNLSYTDFLLTGMIALAIAQGGLFGMVDMVEMRRKGLIKRLRMTPANMSIFGLSDMMMRFIFSFIQIVLLSLIGVFIFGANLYINFPSLILVFLIGALSFNAIGYFISAFSKTTEAYMGVANIISFLMMFLSGVFFPIETMPGWIQPLSNILPLTYFAEGLRDSMVYEKSLFSGDFWLGFGNMILWGGIAFMIGSWLYKRKSIVSTR